MVEYNDMRFTSGEWLGRRQREWSGRDSNLEVALRNRQDPYWPGGKRQHRRKITQHLRGL